MGRVAVVTDSTSDLTPEVVERFAIHVVPLTVYFGEQAYRDGVDITSDEFVERLASAPKLPTTAQPGVGAFEELYKRLATEHDEIISIHISSKLSGTVGSARIAAESVSSLVRVEVVDSYNASLGLGFQVVRAAELAEEGRTVREIAEQLHADADAYEIIFFPDTLTYLQKGGRIGRAQALVGSLLSLKPLLRIEEGQVVPFERTRTRTRARQGLVDFVRGLDHPDRIGVLHSTTPEEASELASELRQLAPDTEVVIARFGPVILTHLGPGGMGVVAYHRSSA